MTSSKRIRVMLVDDQPAVRSALEAVLFIDDDVELVGVAVNGKDAIELCRRCLPDVILMDIRMPKMDGVEATEQICKQYPDVAVLALTSFLEPESVRNMVSAGASGYMLKHVGADELSNAIRATFAGESVLDSGAYKTLFEKSVDAPD